MIYTFEVTETQVIDSEQFFNCANLEEAQELIKLGYGAIVKTETRLLGLEWEKVSQ